MLGKKIVAVSEALRNGLDLIFVNSRDWNSALGIMKPMDSDVFKLNDGHELQYQKYATALSDYESEMFMAVCGDDKFIFGIKKAGFTRPASTFYIIQLSNFRGGGKITAVLEISFLHG